MTKHTLAPDAALALQVPYGGQIHPNGSLVAASVGAYEGTANADLSRIVLVDVATGRCEDLTAPGMALDPVWTADGDAVIYRGVADGLPQLLRVGVNEHAESTVLTEERRGVVAGPFLSPDGAAVAYVALSDLGRDPSQPLRVTRPLWRLDGAGVLEDIRQAVRVMDLETGEIRTVSDNRGIFTSVDWSPDSTSLVVTSFHEPEQERFVIRTVNAAGSRSEVHWYGGFDGFPPAVAWTHVGIVRTDDNPIARGRKAEVLLPDSADGWLPAEGGERRTSPDAWLFGPMQADYPVLVPMDFRFIHDSDGRLLAPVQRGGRREIHTLEPESGAWSVLVAGDFAADPLHVRDGVLLFTRTDMHNPPELWLRTQDGTERPLTSFNSEMFGDNRYFDVERLLVPSEDDEVEAWFLRPKGATGPVPALLNNHGGPHFGWGHLFSFDSTMLAAAGYGVILVNQPGSTGYSEEFALAVHGDWGHRDTDALLAVVDELVARDLIDADRLGVFGASAGGFLTAWLAGHTDRFKAAIVESPLLDWGVMMASDLATLWGDWLHIRPGSSVEAAHRLADLSPATYARQAAATPTLIIHHDLDLRTPSSNSDMYFHLLHVNGGTVEMLRMPGSWHAGSVLAGLPTIRVAQNDAILEWFQRFIPAVG